MSGGFPIGLEVCNGQTVGATSSGATTGTTITASGSTNTKGSYSQIVASTTYDANFVMINIINTTANSTILVDIAIGGAGSEQIVISNLWVAQSASGVQATAFYAFPLNIKAATRISARNQSTVASGTCQVAMQLFSGSFAHIPGYAGYDAIGADTSASTGTSITVSATANTLGSYVQLTSSTARAYAGICGMITLGNNTQRTLTNIAIGGAGSEKVIIPNILFRTPAAVCGISIPFIPIPIPSGNRIAATAQNSASSGNSPVLALYGAYL